MTSTIGNSQGDLYFQDGSGGNILDYDRVIRSAAHKYRPHLIPTSEAIQEEAAENVTKIGGMFKRNTHIDDEDESVPLRKTGTDYIYESNGGLSRPSG